MGESKLTGQRAAMPLSGIDLLVTKLIVNHSRREGDWKAKYAAYVLNRADDALLSRSATATKSSCEPAWGESETYQYSAYT